MLGVDWHVKIGGREVEPNHKVARSEKVTHSLDGFHLKMLVPNMVVEISQVGYWSVAAVRFWNREDRMEEAWSLLIGYRLDGLLA